MSGTALENALEAFTVDHLDRLEPEELEEMNTDGGFVLIDEDGRPTYSDFEAFAQVWFDSNGDVEGHTTDPITGDSTTAVRSIERPTAIDYSHLEPGTWGYWPLVGAVPEDIEPGDRVHFEGDTKGDVVVSVQKDSSYPGWPIRIGYTTVDGKFSVGAWAQGFRLDRWGTSAGLSRKEVR